MSSEEDISPLELFRRSVRFQFGFVLYSGLEIERAVDNICESAQKRLIGSVPSAWQLRDTAPANQSVLVYMPDEDHYGRPVYRAIWVESDYLVDGKYPRHWQVTGLHMGRDVQDERISHWMPLPESASLTERQEP